MACLVERVNRNFDERRLTGVVFQHVAKALNTVWVKGLLHKLTVLNFPSYLVKTISSYIFCLTFVLPVSHIHTSWHAGWYGAGWTRLPDAVQPVCERHTHTLPPRRVSAVCGLHGSVATSRSQLLFVGYLEGYLARLERRLRDWRIAINV
jgi:hypothetical protein